MTPPKVQLEEFSFIIDDGKNRVSWDYKDSWICTCEDFYYRQHECKHIKAVKSELREQVNRALFDDSTCYEKSGNSRQTTLVGGGITGN